MRFAESGHHRKLVGMQAPGERYEKTVFGLAQPLRQIAVFTVPDHVGEAPSQDTRRARPGTAVSIRATATASDLER